MFFNKIFNKFNFIKLKFPSKKAFSVAEAMVTLLLVSVALAATAPIMSKKMISSNTSKTSENVLPSGMVSFFNKPCREVSGNWSEVPNSWQGRYPRIVGEYKICDIDNTCTKANIAYNDMYDDASKKWRVI